MGLRRNMVGIDATYPLGPSGVHAAVPCLPDDVIFAITRKMAKINDENTYSMERTASFHVAPWLNMADIGGTQSTGPSPADAEAPPLRYHGKAAKILKNTRKKAEIGPHVERCQVFFHSDACSCVDM